MMPMSIFLGGEFQQRWTKDGALLSFHVCLMCFQGAWKQKRILALACLYTAWQHLDAPQDKATLILT